MYRCMLDFETLGTRPGCCVLSFGAVFFDETSEEPLGVEFSSVVSVKSQVSLGLHIDPDTAAWWNQQSPEARAAVAEAYTETAPSLETVLENFADYVLLEAGSKKAVQIWGNGSDFDNVILTELYRTTEVEAPWFFYNNRCYRTLKGIVKGPVFSRQGTHHNALDDAKSQAAHAVQLLRVLNAPRPA